MSSTKLYPIFLKLEGKTCLVVGGGSVAFRKTQTLLSSGSRVCIVAQRIDKSLEELAKGNGKIALKRKTFEESDLADSFLVIAATDDNKVNREIYELAQRHDLLVNVVDEPDLCGFFVPAVVERGDLTIAISTGGSCPALAKKIRQKLEKDFDDSLSRFLDVLGLVRKEVMKKYPFDVEKRGKIINDIVNSALFEDASKHSNEKLLEEMKKWI